MITTLVIAGLVVLFLWKIVPLSNLNPGDTDTQGTPKDPDQENAQHEALQKRADDYRAVMDPIIGWLEDCDSVYAYLVRTDAAECRPHNFGGADNYRNFQAMFSLVKNHYREGHWVCPGDLEAIHSRWIGEVGPVWRSHVSGLSRDSRPCANLISRLVDDVDVAIGRLAGLPDQLMDFYATYNGISCERLWAD